MKKEAAMTTHRGFLAQPFASAASLFGLIGICERPRCLFLAVVLFLDKCPKGRVGTVQDAENSPRERDQCLQHPPTDFRAMTRADVALPEEWGRAGNAVDGFYPIFLTR